MTQGSYARYASMDLTWLEPPKEFPLGSPRIFFQWNVLLDTKGPALNVGCADDPFQFRARCHHFDMDDWSKRFARYSAECGRLVSFTQGDAHELTKHFQTGSFELVLLGDTLEHCPEPERVLRECAVVTTNRLALTVWEEWRIPEGLHIEEGQARADHEVQALGYGDRFEHQKHLYPDKVGYADDPAKGGVPHLIHIWHFTDPMIEQMMTDLCAEADMSIEFMVKAPEVVHEGQQVWNWLILLAKNK